MILWIVVLWTSALAEAQTRPPVIGRAYHAATIGNEISPGCAVVVDGSILDSRLIFPTFHSPLVYELEGVRVTVNDIPAPLVRVHSSQVYFIAPEAPLGDVTVKVSNAAGSASVRMVMRRAAPGMLWYGGPSRMVELRDGDDALVQAVRSGQTAVVMATGLGVPAPATLDTWPFGAEVDRSGVTLRVGEAAAIIQSMQIRDPGYFRIAFEMPAVGAGVTIAPIVLEVDGTAIQTGIQVGVDPDTETRLLTSRADLSFVAVEGTQSLGQYLYGRTSPLGIATTMETEDAPWLSMDGSALFAEGRGLAPGLHEGWIKVSAPSVGLTRRVPVSFLVVEAKTPVLRRASAETMRRGRVNDFDLYGTYFGSVAEVRVTPGDGVRATFYRNNMERLQVSLTVDADAAPGERTLSVVTRDGRSSNSVAVMVTGAENVLLESVSPAELLVGEFAQVSLRGSIFAQRPYRLEVDPAEGVSLGDTAVWFNPAQPVTPDRVSTTLTVEETAAEGKRNISVVTNAGRSNSLPLYLRRSTPEILGVWPRKVWPGRIYTMGTSTGLDYGRMRIVGMGMDSARRWSGDDILIVPKSSVSMFGTLLGSGPPDELTGFLQVSPEAAPGMRQIRLQAPGTVSNEFPIEVEPPAAEAPELLELTFSRSATAVKAKLRFRDADGDIVSPTPGWGAKLAAMAVYPEEAAVLTKTSFDIHAPGVKDGIVEFELTPYSIRPITHRELRMAFWMEDAAGNLSNVVILPMQSWP